MTIDKRPDLDALFATLAEAARSDLPDGFYDGVWQRAGQLQEKAEGRQRRVLFCALLVVGLGAGFGTAGTDELANRASFQLSAADILSPAALLRVTP